MSPSKKAIPRSHRVFTPDQKATILRRPLGDKVPVSDLCDEYRLAPSLLHLWQKQALEHLTAALQDGRTVRGESQTASADRARIAALEATIARKDRIIAEVSEEYLDMKKSMGAHDRALGAAGSARRGRRLRDVAEYAHRVARASAAPAARDRTRQVRPLDGIVRRGAHAPRARAARPLAYPGRTGWHSVRAGAAPPRRLSRLDVSDVGGRRRRGESDIGVSRPQSGGVPGSVDTHAVEKRHGV